jgi:putative oxidoreductase
MDKTGSVYQIAPLFLRVIVGTGFMVHGYAKINRGLAGFEKLLVLERIPLAHLSAILVPYIELLGGFSLLIGAYVVIVAIPLLVVMSVAMLAVQWHFGFSSVKTIGLTTLGPQFGPPGYEINLLYIACLISLMITGAGCLSMDRLKKRKAAY